MNRIYIIGRGRSWHALYDGPHAQEIANLFGGSRELPTPYFTAMPVVDVMKRLARLNPGVEIVHVPASGARLRIPA